MNQAHLPKGPMTAGELIRFTEERLRTDPDYRAQVEAEEAERAARAEELTRAEQPILSDLRDGGIAVDSVWRLYEVPDAVPLAVPVLLEHIEREYPAVIIDGIGQALADKRCLPYWSDFKSIYLRTDSEPVRDSMAGVLGFLARREHYSDLLELLANERLGESRLLLLRSINRIGNRIGDKQGRAVIESVADHPQLSREAVAILQGRSRSE